MNQPLRILVFLGCISAGIVTAIWIGQSNQSRPNPEPTNAFAKPPTTRPEVASVGKSASTADAALAETAETRRSPTRQVSYNSEESAVEAEQAASPRSMPLVAHFRAETQGADIAVPAAIQEQLDVIRERLQQTLPAAVQQAAGAAGSTAAQPVPAAVPENGPSTATPPAAEAEVLPPPKQMITRGEGDDQLQIYIPNRPIHEVLATLSEAGGLNILPSKNVQGNVSAALNGVTVEGALEAILRSTGLVARREGKFIYVGTPLDFDAMEQVLDSIGTRVYRPNYVSAKELESLITPLLTPAPVGKIKSTTPPLTKIPENNTDAEGDNYAGTDAVLVQDYEAVLAMIDQIVAEIDKRPAQVAIEAMILSVRLDDNNQLGVDFQFLRDKNHLRFGIGAPLQDLAAVNFNEGLKFAFLDGSLGAFLHALETVGDTNVIATPRLMVINKHRAEILIGSELGYVSTNQTETSTTQNVEFLQVGAQLRLRPFIAHDGLIRMEIHPELSTGSVRIEGGFTLPDKEVTQVTTNIMVRDGYTVVIGGLMREDLITNTNQVPVVGNLPLVGWLFRNKDETTERREILVLVTPRIVHEPDAYQEGELGAGEFHRRQAVYADKMSPLGKRHLGRKYFRLAQEAWDRGEQNRAMRLASLAVQFDPLNRAAIDLRSDIQAGTHGGDHSGGMKSPMLLSPEAIDGATIAPQLLEELENPARPLPRAVESTPPAQARSIVTPRRM